MKTCSNCNNLLSENASYCHFCSSGRSVGFEEFEVKQYYSDTFLKVLCWLTVAGSTIGLLLLPLSWKGLQMMDIDNVGVMFFLSILVILCKLSGAILMLYKMLWGLYIYTAGFVFGMISSIWYITDTAYAFSGERSYILYMSLLGLIFPVAFLIMFWINTNRRLLS